MRNDNIIKQLRDMIYDIANIKNDDMDDVILFNPAWGLKPRDIVYLFLLIQERMGITFLPHEINDISFFTLNNIAGRIEQLVVNG